MRSQVADPSEPLPALLAAVGLLPGVNPLVLLQVPGLREAFPTGVTAERFLPCVDPLMGLQIGQAGESLAASSAYVALPASLAMQSAGGLVFTVVSHEAGLMLCGDSHLNAGQCCCVSPGRYSWMWSHCGAHSPTG